MEKKSLKKIYIGPYFYQFRLYMEKNLINTLYI